MRNIGKILGFIMVLTTLCSSTKGENTSIDSLSLEALIREVTEQHPLVKQAREACNFSNALIGIAQADYLPNADFEAAYTRTGPAPSFTMPGVGSFVVAPNNNWISTLTLSQTFYDFGRTSENVNIERKGKEISTQTVEMIRQRLTLQAITLFYTLVFLQEAIVIKDEQLATLQEHLVHVTTKRATGTATDYEILTTQVRITNNENQKTDMLCLLKSYTVQLNSLMGKPEDTPQYAKATIVVDEHSLSQKQLLTTAMQQRDEIKLGKMNADNAVLHYRMARTAILPSIGAFASAGYKNGYTPSIDKLTANYAVGINLKIPIFDGRRTFYSKQQAKSEQVSIDEENENTRRSVINEVVESEANIEASLKKIEQNELLVKQAAQAYQLAHVKFEAGVITNLELLDNFNALSESKLMLLKARIDYTVNNYKLKAAIGERLY